jgi:hypothetical protein
MAVLFLAFFLFVCQAECISDELRVYQFPPNDKDNNFLSIQSKTPTSQTTGFSFCLRAIFWTWNYRILVETGNIILGFQDPESNLGFLKTNVDYLKFPLEIVSISPNIWNSFCVSLNQTSLQVMITINGQLIRESYCSVGFTPKISNIITIGSQEISGRFWGQITDFNFWNKPLTLTAMEQFSTGCNFNTFFLKLKPEYVLWSEVNITKKGGSTTSYSITREMLCGLLSKNNTVSDVNLLFGYHATYEASVTACDELNGKILMQAKTDENFLKREEQNLQDICSDQFWIFTNISKENNKNSELMSEDHSTINNLNCLYYDVSLKDHKYTGCKETLCFVCQIPEVRQKFQVKSLWDHEQYLESNYFLVNYNGDVAFASLNMRSFLVYSSDKSWTVRQYKYTNYEGIGDLRGKLGFPVGLQTLALYNKNEYQVKLTNVSEFLFKKINSNICI